MVPGTYMCCTNITISRDCYHYWWIISPVPLYGNSRTCHLGQHAGCVSGTMCRLAICWFECVCCVLCRMCVHFLMVLHVCVSFQALLRCTRSPGFAGCVCTQQGVVCRVCFVGHMLLEYTGIRATSCVNISAANLGAEDGGQRQPCLARMMLCVGVYWGVSQWNKWSFHYPENRTLTSDLWAFV